MTKNTIEPQRINGLSQIADQYEAIICDVWGVIHNGVAAWESAYNALSQFRAKGGTVVLITNAPRPNGPVFHQLRGLSVPETAFDAIVTSGDVTRVALAALADKPVFKLGPDKDDAVYAGLNLKFVDRDKPEQAKAVSVTGPFDDTRETPEDYRPLFEGFLARKLPMVCANPDIVVERGNQLIYCGGALAALYEQMGGETIIVGKPHAPIYDRVMEQVTEKAGKEIPRNRVLAIGDGLPTDVKGAVDNGFDCLFVTGGIHAADLGPFETPQREKVGQALAEKNLSAAAFLPRLTW